jgi:hypothetical protein
MWHFQQYFSYIVAQFYWWRKYENQGKTTTYSLLQRMGLIIETLDKTELQYN